jgi:glycosyltransferase involved in cell wall biosynthesis
MPFVVKKFSDIQFMFVGLGSLSVEMKKIEGAFGFDVKVIFTGERPSRELHKYFAIADNVILHKYSEGWSLSVMESMSYGTLLSVSEIPVLEEHPEKKKLFRVFKKGDANDLSRAISAALLNVSALDSQRLKLRLYAENNIGWNIIVLEQNAF